VTYGDFQRDDKVCEAKLSKRFKEANLSLTVRAALDPAYDPSVEGRFNADR